MKPVRVGFLFALAALMTMALIGTSAAMAESTAFCNVDPGEGPEEVCPAGHLVTHLHAVTHEALPAEVLTTVGAVSCTVLYLTDATSSLASPLVLKGNFTYSNCKRGSENCTVTEVSTTNIVEVLKLGHEKADALLSFEMNVHCGIFINCTYGAAGMKGVFRGSLLPFSGEEEEFGEAGLKKLSGICPKEAELDLLVFTLEEIFITK